jgi:predicted aconitase
MLHIAGVTPEADLPVATDADHLEITANDFAQVWAEFNKGDAKVDLVALGSPHFSQTECEAFAALIAGKTVHADVTAIITLGRGTLAKIRSNGTAAILEAAGVTIVPDICWCSISEPVFPPSAKVLMTNSGKYAHYAPGLSNRAVRFGSLAQCMETALSGTATAAPPAWIG